jgi:cation diffusion facilitator CzcD-associated flavoprotein CzcO
MTSGLRTYAVESGIAPALRLKILSLIWYCSSDAPVHMDAQQTLDYLHSYATHFGLNEHIQLNTLIRRVVRALDDKRWQLEILRNSKEQTLEFDKVVFCTGNTHIANVPRIDGVEVFKGKILHSQNFKRWAHLQSYPSFIPN